MRAVVGAAVVVVAVVVATLVSRHSRPARVVEFVVSGSAPNGVDIRYGNDASNYRGHLPLDVTKPLEGSVLYWVMGQLRGGGRITCKVIIGDTVRTGHAVGGHNTCTAQSASDPLRGWN